MNEDDCQAIRDIQSIKQVVNDIKIALLGNEFNDNKGLIYRIIALELEVKKLKARALYMSGVSAGIGIFIGYIIEKMMK